MTFEKDCVCDVKNTLGGATCSLLRPILMIHFQTHMFSWSELESRFKPCVSLVRNVNFLK